MGVKQILKTCLRALDDPRLRQLAKHVAKETPILCGCQEAGYYLVYDNKAEPVILACYANKYPAKEAGFNDLHPDVQQIYRDVSSRLPDSTYALALEEATQWDVREAVRELAKERHMLV